MRLTKFTHSCVQLESDGGRLLVDPGIWCESEVFDGVTDILVTHEHSDHIDFERLTALARSRPHVSVRAPASVVSKLGELGDAAVAIGAGEHFQVAGMTVDTVGGMHAEIIDGLPGCPNIGYIIGGSVYHPGDALHVPDVPVETLLVPVSGPWLKVGEVIDFLRAVAPVRAYPIHDALLSDKGKRVTDRWIASRGGTDYSSLADGTSVRL